MNNNIARTIWQKYWWYIEIITAFQFLPHYLPAVLLRWDVCVTLRWCLLCCCVLLLLPKADDDVAPSFTDLARLFNSGVLEFVLFWWVNADTGLEWTPFDFTWWLAFTEFAACRRSNTSPVKYINRIILLATYVEKNCSTKIK